MSDMNGPSKLQWRFWCHSPANMKPP